VRVIHPEDYRAANPAWLVAAATTASRRGAAASTCSNSQGAGTDDAPDAALPPAVRGAVEELRQRFAAAAAAEGGAEALLGRRCRHLFLLEPGTTYLNHGSYGAALRLAVEAQRYFQARALRAQRGGPPRLLLQPAAARTLPCHHATLAPPSGLRAGVCHCPALVHCGEPSMFSPPPGHICPAGPAGGAAGALHGDRGAGGAAAGAGGAGAGGPLLTLHRLRWSSWCRRWGVGLGRCDSQRLGMCVRTCGMVAALAAGWQPSGFAPPAPWAPLTCLPLGRAGSLLLASG
jgi:hypothetical protein